MFEVKKAKRSRRPLKISLEGLSGSGKTFTLIRLAMDMMRRGIGKRFVIADSENESAGLYEGMTVDGQKWEYEVCQITPEKQNPLGYVEAYEFLTSQGFDLIAFDSMTHAWKGALAKVDQVAARSHNDKFGSGWRTVTPEQERMMATITDGRAHVITTTRVKGDYEQVEKSNGKKAWEKVGLKADQRDGMEYEYDIVIRMERDEHIGVVEKVRGCTEMDGKTGKLIGPEFWKPLLDWWLSADESDDAKILAKIRGAATVAELAAVWSELAASQKTKFLAAKDARKAVLSSSVMPTSRMSDDYPGDPEPGTEAQ